MKKLILIRHAKSDRSAPVTDIERHLAPRGIADAKAVAHAARAHWPAASVIWCSPAMRTRQTAAIFSEHIPFSSKDITIVNALYTFDLRGLERVIKQCPAEIQQLALFGHNEAITDFVRKFGKDFTGRVPTCGLVSIEFDTDKWTTLPKGEITQILFPKQL